MKKAAETLYIIGFILCIVAAAFLLLPSPVLIVLGVSPKINSMVVDAIKEYATDSFASEHAQLFASLLQTCFILSAVFCILIGLACVVNAIVISRTRKEETRGLYIATIILGAFTVNITILAGIFSLIADNKKSQQEE